MRTDVVITVFITIFVFSISSMLNHPNQTVNEPVLLSTVSGTVGWGNFSFWKLSHMGPLIVELHSDEGDADLYVSDNDSPGYEVHQNNFSSTTCGLDRVSIPAEFPRPVGIGVYGCPTQRHSVYTMTIYYDTTTAEYDLLMFMNLQNDLSHEVLAAMYSMDKPSYAASSQITNNKKTNNKNGYDKNNKKKQTESSQVMTSSKVLGVLSIIDMIFELFI